MRIGYLGAGTWGVSLASLLTSNGHKVKLWDRNEAHLKMLDEKRVHPKLTGHVLPADLKIVFDIADVFKDVDIIVESVTSNGIRFVLEQMVVLKPVLCPFVITSKGLEQKTGLLFPEIAKEIFTDKNKHLIGCISGPSHAEEVVKKLPTALVCSAYDKHMMTLLKEIFNNEYFRVYPNADINGVSFGAAMKNIIAIACGISDGLGYGDNTKAALMTRGLHEIMKLCVVKKCEPLTLMGLSGLGDLCVTCLSTLSRNYRFGNLIAKGYEAKKAQEEIGMVVEGVYSCVATVQLAHKFSVPTPISEAVYEILFNNLSPQKAVKNLLARAIKEEHL
jgi:glycerol-3-phosphate dehydrogenase (NAD(P)+)